MTEETTQSKRERSVDAQIYARRAQLGSNFTRPVAWGAGVLAV